MKSTIIFGIIIVFVFLASCVSTEEITKKSELKNAYKKGEILVLATDTSIYKFKEYKFLDSIITGKGVVEKNNVEKEFSGDLKLEDISYIQLRYTNTTNTIFAVAAAGVVGGIALSYLDNETGLGVNESIGRYYPPVSGGGGGSGGGGYGGCCPLIFVPNGNEYELKSETFGGSVFKLAERVCYDNLGYISNSRGLISLKLANYLNETDYMNELKLFYVELPDNVEKVIPTIDGKVHTIKQEVLPEKCIDFSGNDVKSKIIKKDSVIWMSDLTATDLSKKENLRDGLILEFPKPDSAKKCKLIVCGKNTELGIFAMDQLLKLNGDNLLQWYQRIENDQVEGMKLLEWMMREGMLHISIWDGKDWKEQSAIIDPGPILYRENIALLDLKNIKGDKLKIKLETALDLWMINNIYIDFSDDVNLTISELPLIRSRENFSGKDISSLIQEDDNKYYIALPGQYALLEFEAPENNSSKNISFILKTKGYYHPWTAPGEKYEPEIIGRILSEPLLGSAMYMKMWRETKLID